MLKCELDVMEYAVTVEDEFFSWLFGEENEVVEGEEEKFFVYTYEEPELL